MPGDKGIPNGLSETYYKSFAPRIGLAWSPAAKDGFLGKLFGGPGKTSIRAGFGIFYNPVEQLVLEQFSAEPPFGGSTFVFNTQFNTPFLGQDGDGVPESIQRDPESSARTTGGLVVVPADSAVRTGSKESENAIR